MTKFPLFIKTAQNIKHPLTPPIMPLATYEEAVGYERIKVGYKQALRGQRKYTREAVKYDLSGRRTTSTSGVSSRAQGTRRARIISPS